MNTTTARRLAEKAMADHGLTGWYFQWDNAKKRFGQCNYTYKILSFSRFLTEHSEEEDFMATVMHEIAHALVGSGAGHGPVWKAKMRELGQNPSRTKASNAAQREARKAAANYVLTCATSGKVLGHLDRLVKTRRTKYRVITYMGHQCPCHREVVLYNGKSFADA